MILWLDYCQFNHITFLLIKKPKMLPTVHLNIMHQRGQDEITSPSFWTLVLEETMGFQVDEEQ